MTKRERVLRNSCSLFLSITIVFLAPGLGLMTLTIPDDGSDTGVVSSIDYAHPSKQSTEDTSRALADTTLSPSQESLIPVITTSAITTGKPHAGAFTIPEVAIRGPPRNDSISFISS